MKKSLALVAIAFAAVISLAGCATNNNTSDGASSTSTAYFGVTDAAPDMGDIESVEVTIDGISVRGNQSVDIPINETTFDLLELEETDTTELLAKAELDPGVYNQIRLDVVSVNVTDENGEQPAKIPSNQLRLNTRMNVSAGNTATIFDFQANDSLHITGNGRYIMTPVIQIQSRQRADISVNRRTRAMQVRGGQGLSSASLGMDVSGAMSPGVQVRPGRVNVTIENGRVAQGRPSNTPANADRAPNQ